MAKKQKKKKRGMIGRIILLVVLIGLGGGGYFGYQKYQDIYSPNVNLDGKTETFLYIRNGSTAQDVIEILYENGYVTNRNSFEWVAEQKNYSGSNVVPGKYRLEHDMSNNDLIDHLRAGNGRLEVSVQFGQVRTVDELAGRLAQNIEADSTDISDWLHNQDSIGRYGFSDETIIAMFVPNTYRMTWNTNTSQLMQRMALEFKKFWDDDRKARATEAGLSQSEAVTLASIVYWETKMPEDMPRVAGVYMNRLRVGMPLQADPTLIFALGDFTIRRVLNVHKEIDSPYNTYKYAGLPPGPIILPPSEFVDAVLNYEKHDYYYFCAKEDFSGYSNFAKSYQQHLVYARRYQQALNARGVYR